MTDPMNIEKARETLKRADPLTQGWEIADARAFIEGHEKGVEDERKRAEILVNVLRVRSEGWAKEALSQYEKAKKEGEC